MIELLNIVRMFKTKVIRFLITMVGYPDSLEALPQILSKALQFQVRTITSVAVVINKMQTLGMDKRELMRF